jgi:hypothetical protein
MDSGTRRRLVLGFISNWISRLAGTIIQLVQVPVFLHFWSKTLYGEWLIIIAIPSYLTFSSIGFGSVAGNEMTMLMARGEQDAALRVFQSCWWFIIGVCSIVVLALGAALYFLPLGHWLQLRLITPDDAKWVVFYLGCATLFGQLEQLVQSAYTCIGRYPYHGACICRRKRGRHRGALHHGPSQHSVAPLWMESRPVLGNSTFGRPGNCIHGLPDWKCPQPAGNAARRRLCARSG